MIDDFAPQPLRKKPKIVIEPLEKPAVKPLHELAAQEDPSFKTPEQIAADDGPAASTEPTVVHHEAPKNPWYKRLAPKTKWQKILTGVVAIIIAFGIGAGWTHFHHTKPAIAAPVKKQATIKPPAAPILSTLTGLPVADASVNQRPVTGVMIENSTDARPQSGLNQAGVVFEAIAEGGITRFLALYQDTQPDYLGPVRSARPYFVQWCMGFDCALAHVGGSPEALADIPAWGTKNLDQFANASAFERITSRYAPHNVYTSISQLNTYESSRGYGAASYTGFPRKKDAPSKTPNASSIDMAISGYDYNTHYDYDAATDSYKRSEGGAPHMELNKDGSQTQITPKVIVAMVMQYGLEADDHHSQYNVVGSGQAFVFQDGTVTPATWSKTDTKSPLTLTDSSGQAIPLNAGQTWLTALSAANQVTYK